MVEKFLIALALVGIVDAVSYMVVTPSIIFYVLEQGGSRAQYGLVMSAFSFASFCTKPFIGHWSDSHGFRLPYIASLSVAAVGGLVYFFASAQHGLVAVGMILLGRLMAGVGSASSALAFAYMAKAVVSDNQVTRWSRWLTLSIWWWCTGHQHGLFKIGRMPIMPFIGSHTNILLVVPRHAVFCSSTRPWYPRMIAS